MMITNDDDDNNNDDDDDDDNYYDVDIIVKVWNIAWWSKILSYHIVCLVIPYNVHNSVSTSSIVLIMLVFY